MSPSAPEPRAPWSYLADHPDDEKLAMTGQQWRAYQNFFLVRCAELNREIGTLFDPDDLASRVFPGSRALEAVLGRINAPELDDAWQQEETIGWVYQYWTPKELREQARKASKSPLNSYELAFRNQFYTPDYVVRFLVDNTLGRAWYEMKPDTTLRQRCELLLIRPSEEVDRRAKKDPTHARLAGSSAHVFHTEPGRASFDNPSPGPYDWPCPSRIREEGRTMRSMLPGMVLLVSLNMPGTASADFGLGVPGGEVPVTGAVIDLESPAWPRALMLAKGPGGSAGSRGAGGARGPGGSAISKGSSSQGEAGYRGTGEAGFSKSGRTPTQSPDQPVPNEPRSLDTSTPGLRLSPPSIPDNR